ncbi:MAG: hypothetical protein ACREC1_00055 [Methylovirgula sp.]
MGEDFHEGADRPVEIAKEEEVLRKVEKLTAELKELADTAKFVLEELTRKNETPPTLQ